MTFWNILFGVVSGDEASEGHVVFLPWTPSVGAGGFLGQSPTRRLHGGISLYKYLITRGETPFSPAVATPTTSEGGPLIIPLEDAEMGQLEVAVSHIPGTHEWVVSLDQYDIWEFIIVGVGLPAVAGDSGYDDVNGFRHEVGPHLRVYGGDYRGDLVGGYTSSWARDINYNVETRVFFDGADPSVY